MQRQKNLANIIPKSKSSTYNVIMLCWREKHAENLNGANATNNSIVKITLHLFLTSDLAQRKGLSILV